MRRLLRRIGHWGFTIMIVPKRGGVRRLAVPWLGAIGSTLLLLGLGFFLCYSFWYYPQSHRSISNLSRMNRRLRKENEAIKPALKRTQQLEKLVNDYKKMIDRVNQSFRSIRQKSASISSRSGSYRLESYRLPDPIVAGDGAVSLLETVTANTDSLIMEITRNTAGAAALEKQLQAYERELDHTPSYMPVRGRLTSRFGYRTDPFTRRSRFHEGIDLVVRAGTLVHAAADGVVVEAAYRGGYGRRVVIDHGYGYRTAYAHNSALLVAAGQRVKKGQAIARSGSSGRSTGPHLHFEVFRNGWRIDPLSIF